MVILFGQWHLSGVVVDELGSFVLQQKRGGLDVVLLSSDVKRRQLDTTAAATRVIL